MGKAGRRAYLHRQVSDGESLDGRVLVRSIAIKLSTPFVPLDGVQRVALGVVPAIQRRRVALLHSRRYLDAHLPQARANSYEKKKKEKNTSIVSVPADISRERSHCREKRRFELDVLALRAYRSG